MLNTQDIKKVKYGYVYFFDINNLREINRQGHSVGDTYICSIVQKVKPCVDGEIIRYGGDEFIVLSNKQNLLKTNSFFTVGKAKVVEGNIMNAIRKADRAMLIKKEKLCNSRLD